MAFLFQLDSFEDILFVFENFPLFLEPHRKRFFCGSSFNVLNKHEYLRR